MIVGIDCFSRYVFAQAVKDTTSCTFIQFLTRCIGIFAVPQKILTDNAKTFQSRQLTEISKLFGYEHIFSTPLHSEGNAIAERVIQTLQEKINLIQQQTGNGEEHWDTILPVVTLSINTATHRSTGYSPFELTFGRSHHFNGEGLVDAQSKYDIYLQLIQRTAAEIRANASESQQAAQVASKRYFDTRHRTLEFDIAEKVWIKAPKRQSKLANEYEGPFEIISRQNDIYKLRCTKTNQDFSRHVNQLKSYIQPSNHHHTNDDGQPDNMNLAATVFTVTLLAFSAFPFMAHPVHFYLSSSHLAVHIWGSY